MAKDRYGYGTYQEGGEAQEQMEKYYEWLEPYLQRTQKQYPDMDPNKMYFQTLSDILEKSTMKDMRTAGKDIMSILSSEYNKLLKDI